MNKYFSIFALAIMVLCCANVQASTYHQIIIDGTNDFVANEMIVDDVTGDNNSWGGNELDNLYVTWDATNLYLGADATFSGNTLSFWIMAGDGSSATDVSTIGWPRKLEFSGMAPDWVVHKYDGGGCDLWSYVDSSTANWINNPSNWQAADYFEVLIPWTDLGFQTSQVISIVCTITGDNWGSCDAMPAQSIEPDGDGIPDVIDVAYTLTCDSNGDGTPEDLWDPSTNSAVVVAVQAWDLY